MKDIIEDKEKSSQGDFADNIGQTISKHAPKQASRMIRQKVRMNEVKKIISEAEGTDIRLHRPIILSKEETKCIGYDHIIKKNLDEARVQNYSISCIDDCLIVIASKASKFQIMHLLYHFFFPQSECKLGNGSVQDIEEERKTLLSFAKSNFLIDLVPHNIYGKSSPPYFFMRDLGEDDIFDLLFGRLKILVFLDIQRFLELISQNGFSHELLSKKETEDLRKELGRLSFPLHNDRAIQIRHPNGHDFIILAGTLDRIFSEFIRPTELIRIWEIEPSV